LAGNDQHTGVRSPFSSLQNGFCIVPPGTNIPAELNPLPDAYEIEGPLNGILSAFKLDAAAPWLVIALL
jgi:hypothetical protein